MNIDISDINDIIKSLPRQLYYGGKWHNSSDNVKIPTINPCTEEEIGQVESASQVNAQEAVDAAANAFSTWSNATPRSRAEILRKAFKILVSKADYFAKVITLEHGKAIKESYAETIYSAEFFRWFSEEGVRNRGEFYKSPHSGADILVHHKPAGVALLITPWNFPLAMATRKIAPALAAGCTVVVKPASATPYTMLALVDVLEEAGVPPGVVNILPSNRASQVMPTIIQHPMVRVISFTGSTAIGHSLLRSAADYVLNCSMELGGNAPFIVCQDADVSAAVDGAMIAKMRNLGESCVAANRFYVHEKVYDSFANELTARMRALSIGNGLDISKNVGALISGGARKEIHELVEDAVTKGGTLLTGGKIPEGKGYFYPPTVIGDIPLGARVLKDEIFGPVAPIRKYTDDAILVKEANDTEHGLCSYVYSGDTGHATRIASQLETGMVGINRGLISDPAAPFGGVKFSGLGREGSHQGLDEFLETQYMSVNLT